MEGKQVYLLEQAQFNKLMNDVSEIKEFLRGLKPQDAIERPVPHKEAAAFLNISPDTLTRRIKNREYPASIVHRNGKMKVYYKSELKALIQ